MQIDTISVIQRAHHHTLWNRNQDYQLNHLDKLLDRREVFEYWSHAAVYLPMRDYRFSLHQRTGLRPVLAIAAKTMDGACSQTHWRAKGPLMAKDFFEGDRPKPRRMGR
ncbi:winged helix DNA-binding domain-containing protein [Vibrio lentus]|nr:winged helix DNA-binding domain-containing protein [Vibrio lentus]